MAPQTFGHYFEQPLPRPDQATRIASPGRALLEADPPVHPERPAGPYAVLRFVTGPRRDQLVRVGHERSLVCGRGASADLRIRDPYLSRRHLRMVSRPGGVQVTDLGSRNGTYVRGHRVRQVFLREGERVLLGGTLVEVGLVGHNERQRRAAG